MLNHLKTVVHFYTDTIKLLSFFNIIEIFLVSLIVTQLGGPAHNNFPPGIYSQESPEKHRALSGQNRLGEFRHLQPCRDGGVCAALQRGTEQGEDDGKTEGFYYFMLLYHFTVDIYPYAASDSTGHGVCCFQLAVVLKGEGRCSKDDGHRTKTEQRTL